MNPADLSELLVFLLPGFVAAAVFYWLTSIPKPRVFERVVQALVLTAIVQSSAWLMLEPLTKHISALARPPGKDAFTVLLAAGIGLLFAVAVNQDWVHRVLRGVGMTRENSYKSAWRSTFSSRTDYVVLHLSDGRRLYGWPAEWPNRADEGHFKITEAEWLASCGERTGNEASAILLPASDVRMVEFVEPTLNSESEE